MFFDMYRRRGVATIIAGVIVFALLFTSGTEYFLFEQAAQSAYNTALVNRSNAIQAQTLETGYVTTADSGGYIAFTVTNSGSLVMNVTGVVVDAPGTGIYTYGPSFATNTSPALPLSVGVGQTSANIKTSIVITGGVTYTLEVTTSSGNTFSQEYPEPIPPWAQQAESSGSLAISLTSLKWYLLTGNAQSGYLVNGYPGTALPVSTTSIGFSVQFTNVDSSQRSITLWAGSEIQLLTMQPESNGKNLQVDDFYIIQGFSGGSSPSGIIGYNSTENFVVLPYDQPETIYFGATAPYGATASNTGSLVEAPFQALFSLIGQYSDNTLYAQGIPFPAGVITSATATLSTTVGATGSAITVAGSGFLDSRIGFIGWMSSTGTVSAIQTFTTTSGGDLPSNLQFTVPSDSAGYYTVVVSDYYNALFFTFQHT
jgi:hypothetical protein